MFLDMLVLVLLFVLLISTGETKLQDCSNDLDCKPYAYCHGDDANVKGKCKCSHGFKMNRNQTSYQCLEIKYVGDPCEINEECQLSESQQAAICNESKRCACDSASYSNTGICYFKRKLDESCTDDKNCYINDGTPDGTNALCIEGQCKCNSGQLSSADKTQCLQQKKLGENCDVNEQCSSLVPYSTCNKELCECTTDYVQVKNACFKVAQQLGDVCEFDEQCSKNLANSTCIDKKCNCKSNFQNFQNKCLEMKKIAQICENNDQCSATVPNSICKEICVCGEKYTETPNLTACVEVTQNFGDPCQFDGQCSKFLLKSSCKLGQCGCLNDSRPDGSQCVRTKKKGESCQKNAECYSDRENLKCEQNTCQSVQKSEKILQNKSNTSISNLSFTSLFLIFSSCSIILNYSSKDI